jgi:signal transduction histidine kinase
MSRVPAATYAESVDGIPGVVAAARGGPRALLTVLGRAVRDLAAVVAGPEPPPVWQTRSAPDRRALLLVVGVATLALCFINVSTMHGLSGPGQGLLAVVVVAPLPLAVRRPMLAWRLGWLALALVPVVPAHWWGGWPWGPPQVIALLAAFGLAGVRQSRSALWWMWALTLVPWLFWLVGDVRDRNGPVSASLVFTAAAFAVDSLRSRLLAQRELAAQTRRAEAEEDRRAVLEERARIARELHDVVAHHMSLIAVRAETAPYRLAGLPEPVAGEFGALSELARETMADMRRLLGVLRQDQPAELAPQPQLADLPALVAATRRAGMPVELRLAAELGEVPAGVGVCAYRIVQESLSNASQHAPGAAVTVSVGQADGAVRLRVANGPGLPPGAGDREHRPGEAAPSAPPRQACSPGGTPPRPAGGHGLIGMRERVALLGGSLSAGPAPGGGFVVSAVLPVGEAA